ncbi:hypothetical protein [Edaphobacter aggregans]|uniref:hypothetical protein n=1 Tax=Edaphobacter aggregans TaxID=570835 RepID=UPI00054D731E|nr:hypothetical protein [Edaphobacter aggregans]
MSVRGKGFKRRRLTNIKDRNQIHNDANIAPAINRWRRESVAFCCGSKLCNSCILPPPPQPAVSFEQSLPLDDHALAERLKDHLSEEAEHYYRILDLARNHNLWARRFEGETWGAAPTSTRVIEKVAPVPLEVIGSQIAFPLLDQPAEEPLTPEVPTIERLISLPTRGIFAEAKLGHCNVAEEIDETRFWRWDEHPLPFVASEIAPQTSGNSTRRSFRNTNMADFTFAGVGQ